MESLVLLFNKWEIQLLVLLSFTLQMFLFFAGSLRRRSKSMLLRLSLWMAYLGADFVAIYALGFLSRHSNSTTSGDALWEIHPLAILWVPFLLVHLGGQDTITAFANEDNNLWLRHLLNMVVQVILALSVFWKSIGIHNVQLLVPSIFMFVAGIIKYGERTWALKYGSSESIGRSSGGDIEQAPQVTGSYSDLVFTAQGAMGFVRYVFGERREPFLRTRPAEGYFYAVRWMESHFDQVPKLLDVELGMMYHDLYTKAMVFRRRSGIILRCFSQISAMIALVFFLLSNKRRYSRADVAITYVLFTGSFFLEVCATHMFMTSPWTWAWLMVRKWHRLAGMSWRLLSSNIEWPEEGMLWSCLMGQLDINKEWWHLSGSDVQATLSRKQRVMVWIRNLVGAKTDKLVWISKLIGTKYIEVDYKIMELFFKELIVILDQDREPRQWPQLGPALKGIMAMVQFSGLVSSIGRLKVATELHLRKYSSPSADGEVRRMVDICHKESNYIVYLLVTHPSTVPSGGRVEDVLWLPTPPQHGPSQHASSPDSVESPDASSPDANAFRQQSISSMMPEVWFGYIIQLPPSEETLREFQDMWIRLLIYIAGKSSSRMHAQQLVRGGELLTHLWLFMAHLGIRENGYRRIELTNATPAFLQVLSVPNGGRIYAFHLHDEGSQPQNPSTTSEGAEVVQIV